MKNLTVNYLMNLIIQDGNYDKTKLQEIKYGLEAIYLNVSKLIIFFIINFLIGNLLISLLFFLFYIPIKGTGWGFHAKESWQCWIISAIAFIGFPLLSNYLHLTFNTKIIFCICFLLAMWCWAPADTPKRPLVNKNKRIALQIGSLIITTIYSILILYTNLSNILISALLFQCFLINPFTYMLFNTPYKNYLNYHLRKELI